MKARLQALSKADLGSVVLALGSHVDPALLSRVVDDASKRAADFAPGRPFNMAAYGQRRVALRVCYFGDRYHGFAANNDSDEDTVEGVLLAAMRKVRLIEGKPSDYSRCGRTDKGVSALCQIVALTMRKHAKPDSDEDVDYCMLLNRVLPDDIFVTAWSPCADDFDARFKCLSRTYRYYVHLPSREYDIEAMRAACALFEGTHDFRNFCKYDIENTTHFVRRVVSCRLVLDAEGAGYCEIKGTAFLWHQVRMMMSILFLVGARREEPTVITRMFDVEAMPRRPSYEIAAESPLILYDAEYPADTFLWRISEEASKIVALAMHQRWTRASLGSALCRDAALAVLDGAPPPSTLPATHVPLEMRGVGKSFEERLSAAKPEKRQRHAGASVKSPASQPSTASSP